MSLQKIFPVKRNANGQPIRCSRKGCRRVARHEHHIVPQCVGGSDDSSNLEYLCQKCHVAHHSARGDFSRWGSVGGSITAQKMISIPNLKQFQGEAGRARWIAYCERRSSAQMGWAS